MFLRMILGAVTRQKKKLMTMACAMTLGISLATAMLNVMLDVGDKINQELKTYGANIMVTSRGASFLTDLYGVEEGAGVSDKYLLEDELSKMKTIFWAFNIVDFTPYLDAVVSVNDSGADVPLLGTWFRKHLDIPTGESVDTGIINLRSWWDVRGAWLRDEDQSGVMVGEAFAAKHGITQGDNLRLSAKNASGTRRTVTVVVRSIFHSGDKEDGGLLAPLATVQYLTGLEGKVRRVEVSALTTPENDLARRAAQNPHSLSRQDWEVWYCTAYVSAIAFQIEEVLTDARVKPVLQVAESEGAILQKTRFLMLLLTLLSLACSAFAISNLVTANVMERSTEIGLLKALGATDDQISFLILTEMLIATITGGVFGYAAGLGLASVIGYSVFGSAVTAKGLVIPIVALLVLLVTIGGSLPAIRMLLRLRPADVLHGR
ncbi:ABC transporter permease [Candidatus Desulfovibrio trichonymphae]|uniref:ABC efflux transporter permease n=1 Tax=Candidatus Desulfovibrio trichonymphae TaxID=1725232 RepID=A0A1J1E224_9BACT|nr:ABC transporter permease [Candidatus Desulfovibrio trichonymphae]BAV91923.1 ABC efflux transporter permease [Candidatus Desulfovibrio trichonymphae]GHU91688.1 ABC transporter permease [Deltaproteobacteria bacterium]GHU97668.1 ABC transporter permease [Deltaproteobacteria bacterium]